MKINLLFIFSIAICIISSSALASDQKEKIYLTQMINQLDSLKPLIVAASKEQSSQARIRFHYTSYNDIDGKPHNGLLDDINEIEKGIQEKLNDNLNEPHSFQAIKGDYLDIKEKPHVQ